MKLMRSILLLFLIGFNAVAQQSVQTIQSIDGAQRNRLEEIIRSTAGGSSSSVDVTSTYTWTGTNSFLKPTYMGTNGTYGTGSALVAGAMLYVVPQGSAAGNTGIGINSLGLGNSAGLGISAGANNRLLLGINGSGNAILNVGKGAAAFDLSMGDGTTNMLSVTDTTATLGFNSSTAYTFPGTTWTSANGLNINSDTLWFNASKNVNIGTNAASQAGMTIQMSTAGLSTGMFIRAGVSTATAYVPLLIRDNTAGGSTMTVFNNGSIQFGGNSACLLANTGLTFFASSSEAYVRNAGSGSLYISGGTAAGSYVRIDGGGVEAMRVTGTGVTHYASSTFQSNYYIAYFRPAQAEPPTNNYAIFTTVNSRPALSFDNTTGWSTIFTGAIPAQSYVGSGLQLITTVSAPTNTGTASFFYTLERVNSGSTYSTNDNFSTVFTTNAAFTMPSTTSIITNINTYIPAASLPSGFSVGDLFRLKMTRDVSGSTCPTNIFVYGVRVKVP